MWGRGSVPTGSPSGYWPEMINGLCLLVKIFAAMRFQIFFQPHALALKFDSSLLA